MKSSRLLVAGNGILRGGALMLAALQVFVGVPTPANAQTESPSADTKTPIKHVIVIIGENRSFDHLYGTYKPKNGQRVSNLLSKGIVTENGGPGPNYSFSAQYSALDNTGTFSSSPQYKSIYGDGTLPPVMTGGAPQSTSDTNPAPFQTLAVARLADQGLARGYERFLLTGATGIPSGSIDTRYPHPTALREGVYQLSPHISSDDYSASPVHRFFQMWQQEDCSADYSTGDNPSGCLSDLFAWVETSVGAGSNGKKQPANFTDQSTGEGSAALGFYNVARGDARYFKYLADNYTINDNFHQAVMGGTGANHIMFGYADAIWYSDGKGNALTPPTNQIENPNPQTNTNNYYDQDGYSGGSYV
ncbi:MAG TPA: alkaline phosphatase family protein, partial [Pseudacidobacterium sp.]|nr:alkaline phosphatase family protein [Pseudacidobacterium sp.]